MILEVLIAVGVGTLSAVLPVVNAEAFQAGSVLLQPRSVVLACVLGLAVGQTAGKVIIFTASRRGAGRWRSTHAGRRSRAPGWVQRTNVRLLGCLSHRTGGPAAVAVSATTGVPPLVLVSATAGASAIRCWVFSLACLGGRLVRFGALAGGVTALMA